MRAWSSSLQHRCHRQHTRNLTTIDIQSPIHHRFLPSLLLGPFTLESFFRKSTFERKLSGVNGPLWKVYHFRKWLSQNRTRSVLWKWTVHTWKFSFKSRLSKATFERNFPVWKGPYTAGLVTKPVALIPKLLFQTKTEKTKEDQLTQVHLEMAIIMEVRWY